MANSTSSRGDPLVLDTSVVINLSLSRAGERIIRALSRPVLVVDIAANELAGGRGLGAQVEATLMDWDRQGLAKIVDLHPDAMDVYESLVLGDGRNTLDDGEAATIAHAMHLCGSAAVDEAKACRLCRERFPQLGLASSASLMTDRLVVTALGEAAASDAVFNALHVGRMRVPHELVPHVVRMIGLDRAAACRSLPAPVRNQAL